MALRIDIITLFPEIFFGPLASSITGRAMRENKVEIRAIDLRDFTHDRRKTVDDKPFGGGPGMLMKVEPLFEAVCSLKQDGTKVILTGPAGGRFTQKTAYEMVGSDWSSDVCSSDLAGRCGKTRSKSVRSTFAILRTTGERPSTTDRKSVV